METIKGTIERVARTGGIILEEHKMRSDGKMRWFNLFEGIKKEGIEKLKSGQVVEFEISEQDFITSYKIIQETSPQKLNQYRLMKTFYVISPEDFPKLILEMNDFCKSHNVSAVVFVPRCVGEGYNAVLWYVEES